MLPLTSLSERAPSKASEPRTVPYRPKERPLAFFNQVTSLRGEWKGHNPSDRVMHNTAKHRTPRSLDFVGCIIVRAGLNAPCLELGGAPSSSDYPTFLTVVQ